MDLIATFAQSLHYAGLTNAVIDTCGEPYHIVVALPGNTVEDEPVLRINLLESGAGDLHLWQMIIVFPEQAVSQVAWALTPAMLNPLNRVLTAGKIIADEDSQMLFATYNHLTPPRGSAQLSGPPVVRFFLENCAVLAPRLATALTRDPGEDRDANIDDGLNANPDLDEVLEDFNRSKTDLESLLIRLMATP